MKTCPHKVWHMNVHSSFIHNAPKLKRTQMSITDEWINKIWTIQNMNKLLIHTTIYMHSKSLGWVKEARHKKVYIVPGVRTRKPQTSRQTKKEYRQTSQMLCVSSIPHNKADHNLWWWRVLPSIYKKQKSVKCSKARHSEQNMPVYTLWFHSDVKF